MTLDAVPEDGTDDSENWRRTIGVALNRVLVGGGDNVDTVELGTGTVQSVLVDRRIGITSKILLLAESSQAATSLYSGDVFVKVSKVGEATITHGNEADVITFSYVVAGS